MRAPSLAPLVLAVFSAASVRADQVLHEFVPNVNPDEAAIFISQASAEPAAIVYEGELLPAPDADAMALAQPPMVATPGDGRAQEEPGQRSPTFRPDRITDLEERLSYYSSFNPAIAPFKRVTSLDATRLSRDGVTPLLEIFDMSRTPVPVEGGNSEPPDDRPRDRFWGDVTLDFSVGRTVPLPSVSPESRILSLRSAPAMALRVEKDGADNYFVVAVGKPPSGPVRITFLTDAPRAYFGTEIDAVPPDPDDLPPLPPSIASRALRFAAELGLERGQDLHRILHTLTRHFRDFQESSEPPADTGDIYLDLARAKKGICRHRAYGFVVTAHALGVATRFVQNEAHSWVEVKLASGWLRIDLGGAAGGLTAHGAANRPVYRPATPDTLPRPAAYENSYSQLRNNVTGLRQPDLSQLAGRWVPPDDQGRAARASGHGSFMGGPDGRLPADRSRRKALSLSVDQRRVSVLRGRQLQVSGRVTQSGGQGANGVSDMRVEVSLARTVPVAQDASSSSRDRMLLGVTVSKADGYFQGSFGIPPDLSVGEYQLVVVTPGNADFLPALAE